MNRFVALAIVSLVGLAASLIEKELSGNSREPRELPTVLDVRYGWKMWKISCTDDGDVEQFRLRSVVIANTLWEPREVNKARCAQLPISIRHDLEEIPHKNCMCGIYALHKPDKGKKYGEYKGTWTGQVKLWGKVIGRNKGVKGQFAYPHSLSGGFCFRCGQYREIDVLNPLYYTGKVYPICQNCWPKYRIMNYHTKERMLDQSTFWKSLEDDYGIVIEGKPAYD
jgi:hypothetical protein